MSTKDDYDIVICKCPDCGKIMKLSFDKGKDTRYTYCINCEYAVVWEKIKN